MGEGALRNLIPLREAAPSVTPKGTLMRLHEHLPEALTDFLLKTLPGAVGTTVYALTNLGPVAWITFLWVLVQMVRFIQKWYREDRSYHRRRARLEDEDDTYPGKLE